MKKIRLTLLLCLLLAAGNNAICQASASPITHPTVIPPSPEAQAFMRYGEYPVDYSTGVPKIDIPVYEIKSGKLSLPISISYHASGIRVDDVASVVGLGWRLNAGGGLTRTVKGRPDEESQGILAQGSYLTETGINNATSNVTNFYKLRNVARGAVDAESDNYYYSAGTSLSGQFVYDHLNNLTPLSYTDDKIIRHNNPSNMVSGYWYEVVSADGTRYIFDSRESTTFDTEAYPSTYWLSKIISADGTDEITFEYETSIYAYNDRLPGQSWTFDISPVAGTSGLFFSVNSSINYPVYLKKIKFKNGYMSFDYAGDRLDLRRNRLTAISIYSNATTLPLKKYQFVQSYFFSGFAETKYNYRLKLDALNIYDANSALTSYNTFSYNEDNILPPYFDPSNVYQNPAYAVDFWGYYNGQIQNPHLIPNVPAPNISANRTPNETFAKACMLNKITYPTGGYTSFEYQSNITGEQSGVPKTSGGLRIHRIISKADDVATPNIKRYEYANDLLMIDMDAYGRYSYPQQIIRVNNSTCSYLQSNSMTYFNNPIVPFQSHNGSPVLYQIVSEYSDGGTESLKTTYTYEGQPDIVYSVNSPRYQNQYNTDRSWRRGQLSGMTHFKLVNGNYQPVKWTSNDYADYRAKTIITGTLVQEVIVTPASSTCFGDGFTPGNGLSSRFYYFDQKIEVGVRKLIREYTTEKDDNGNEIVTTKNITYGSSNHLFPTTMYYFDSKGDERKTQLKYPHDFAGSSVYDSMIRKNIIAPVIEQQKYKNTTFLESVKTNYNFYGALIQPQTVESKILNKATETRLRFDSYDNTGNVTSFSNENDIKKVFVFGYNNTYPVAEVIGETYAHVSGVLNNSILQNPSSDQVLRDELQKIRQNFPAALVNTYTYKQMMGITSKTDAANRTTYYEYDAFGRLVLVRDQDGNAVKKVCYNYAGQPENCSGIPVFLSAGTVINFTRNNCQTGYVGSVVPYMVAPGKYTSTISQLNADQQAMTEANANGQLKANTNGSCSPKVYVNDQKSGFFIRSNCGTGYTGGGKAYVVLQGKYSSTIGQAYVNQLAQNDVDANGQAYADQFGDCTLMPTIVDVKNNNFTSQTFIAKFTNTSTNVVYQYSVGPSGGGAQLGQIPVGTYNITVTSGGSDLYEWNVGGFYQAGIHTFSATGVYLSDNGTIEISYY